jgi:hypothetical protein
LAERLSELKTQLNAEEAKRQRLKTKYNALTAERRRLKQSSDEAEEKRQASLLEPFLGEWLATIELNKEPSSARPKEKAKPRARRLISLREHRGQGSKEN